MPIPSGNPASPPVGRPEARCRRVPCSLAFVRPRRVADRATTERRTDLRSASPLSASTLRSELFSAPPLGDLAGGVPALRRAEPVQAAVFGTRHGHRIEHPPVGLPALLLGLSSMGPTDTARSPPCRRPTLLLAGEPVRHTSLGRQSGARLARMRQVRIPGLRQLPATDIL